MRLDGGRPSEPEHTRLDKEFEGDAAADRVARQPKDVLGHLADLDTEQG